MIQEAVLLRSANKAVTYIEKYVTRVGPEKREEVLDLFDHMHQLFPQWVIGTCPIMHPEIKYVSKNCPHIFGYTTEYLIGNSKIDKYFTHVHEADQQDLYDCFSVLHDHMESIAPENHHTYRAILHYRFRKANGQYMYLHDEKASLQLRGSGNLYYTLFRDITTEKTFSGAKIELYNQGTVLEKIREFKPSAERNTVSRREKELLQLMRQGLSTKEIGFHLNISHNTVRNIKSKLFEKFNASSSIELLNMVQC